MPLSVTVHTLLAASNSRSLAMVTPCGADGAPVGSSCPDVIVTLSKNIYPCWAVFT